MQTLQLFLLIGLFLIQLDMSRPVRLGIIILMILMGIVGLLNGLGYIATLKTIM